MNIWKWITGRQRWDGTEVISFNISPAVAKRLDELVMMSGADSRLEVFQRALSNYDVALSVRQAELDKVNEHYENHS